MSSPPALPEELIFNILTDILDSAFDRYKARPPYSQAVHSTRAGASKNRLSPGIKRYFAEVRQLVPTSRRVFYHTRAAVKRHFEELDKEDIKRLKALKSHNKARKCRLEPLQPQTSASVGLGQRVCHVCKELEKIRAVSQHMWWELGVVVDKLTEASVVMGCQQTVF